MSPAPLPRSGLHRSAHVSPRSPISRSRSLAIDVEKSADLAGADERPIGVQAIDRSHQLQVLL